MEPQACASGVVWKIVVGEIEGGVGVSGEKGMVRVDEYRMRVSF